jgi:nucleoid-associated protein YgaU
MDLFGFVKDVGRRLFKKDEEAAEKIKQHILASNPGVADLEVTFENGVVDVYASALTPFVVPKPEEVPIGGPHQHAHATPVETREEYYVIERGDTLSHIARRYYGNANKWPRLFEANREVIQDPDKIFPGQKIRVPID